MAGLHMGRSEGTAPELTPGGLALLCAGLGRDLPTALSAPRAAVSSPRGGMGGRLRQVLLALTALACLWAGTGCSLRRAALQTIGEVLADSGKTFSADDDPELVKAALPFSLKLTEALLVESPRNPGLLTAAASGFTQYAYGFVQQESDVLRSLDLARSRELQARAKRLYLRARDYGLQGLEVTWPGFVEGLQGDPGKAVAVLRREDVPLLYWTAAAWSAALAADKGDALLISDLPKVDALLERALELDEAFGYGALPTLMITYETVRQGVDGDPYARAEQRFHRALALSAGKLAGPYVNVAEAVCVPTEDRTRFLQVLDAALALDPAAAPEVRLNNLIMQDRARWLRAHVDDYFLPAVDGTP